MPSKKDGRAGNIKLLKQTGGTAKKPIGVWRVRLPLGRDKTTGTPRNLERRVAGGEDAAWDLLVQMRHAPRARMRQLSPTTVEDMLTEYLDNLVYLGREATTIASYGAIASKIKAVLGPKLIGSVTRSDVDLLYRGLVKQGRSANTLRRYHAVLSGAFKRARDLSLLLEDAALPTDRVELPVIVRYRAETVDVPGALAVLERAREVDSQLGLALALAVGTGCRRGEICGLQWKDLEVDGEGWRLKVRRSVASVPGRPWFVKGTKTMQDRTLALDGITAGLLIAARAAWPTGEPAPDAFILANLATDDTGRTPQQPDWLTWGWREHADALGVKARLHDLRHLHATALLEVGTPLTTVSKRLGHSKVSTTLDIYSHVTEGRDQEAADTIGRLMAKPLKAKPAEKDT